MAMAMTPKPASTHPTTGRVALPTHCQNSAGSGSSSLRSDAGAAGARLVSAVRSAAISERPSVNVRSYGRGPADAQDARSDAEPHEGQREREIQQVEAVRH